MLAITIVIKNDKKVDYAKKKTLINITPAHNKDIHMALYFHRFKYSSFFNTKHEYYLSY